jgi:hypothetical protein
MAVIACIVIQNTFVHLAIILDLFACRDPGRPVKEDSYRH